MHATRLSLLSVDFTPQETNTVDPEDPSPERHACRFPAYPLPRFLASMRWAVVLAGGSGTRFWPLSTPENPKQLLPLAGSTSTAEEAIDRLAGVVPKKGILLVAGSALPAQLRQRLHLQSGQLPVRTPAPPNP